MQSATPKILLSLVWPLSLSLAATYGIDVSFSSSAYLDVSVQRVSSTWLCIYHAVIRYCRTGFPHSDICGSMDICSLPQLFAACHVLLRLLMPSHSPYALYSLTNLVWFLNYIRIRDLFEIEVFTHILSYIEKTFPH